MAEIRFQLDEHMPNAVAEALRRRGIDVLTVADADMLGVPDAELLQRCVAEARVVVTKDSDFLRLHREQHRHAGIVYSKQGTRKIGEIIARLALIDGAQFGRHRREGGVHLGAVGLTN